MCNLPFLACSKASASTSYEKTDLSGADFTDSLLMDADLSGASIEGAVFRDANLVRANLDRCRIEYADLRGALLQDTIIPKPAECEA